jgi:cytoskeletal protein CcmA (bactofilin family)
MAIFNQSKPVVAPTNTGAPNIINGGTTIIGDLTSDGDMRIDGTVKGYIQCKARLVIGPTARIEGDIKSANLEVSGTIEGNITVIELLTVKASAKVIGDIIANKLIIESGAEFNGHCSMRDSKNVIKPMSGISSSVKTSDSGVKEAGI